MVSPFVAKRSFLDEGCPLTHTHTAQTHMHTHIHINTQTYAHTYTQTSVRQNPCPAHFISTLVSFILLPAEQ